MALQPRKDREEQKYIYLEKALQDANREFIALNEEEKRRNNVILNQVLVQIVEQMKKKSKLFATMYRKEYYGGTYFDNLKVTKPDEYDLDLLLDLPKLVEPVLEISDIPGSVHIRLENVEGFLKQLYSDEFPNLANKLLDEHHYLSTRKVLSWIESVLTMAVNEFPPLSARVKQIDTRHGIFNFTVHKQGPAFTLKLRGTVDYETVKIDIDLVPCFVFSSQKWPRHPYRINPVPKKPEFFVVPKEPKAGCGIRSSESYWRLSFQEQEGVLINSLQNLKPTLRLLKKLRDACISPYIASYYLKTMFLWEVEENSTIWNKPLSYVFMTMLKKYQQYIESRRIPYFWNEYHNLIGHVNSDTLFIEANMLRLIINDVERNPGNPNTLIRYLSRVRPEPAVHEYWNHIENCPEINPLDSMCVLF